MVVYALSPDNTHNTALARLLGSTVSGVCELFLFHPVDTIAKRLMTNTNCAASLSEKIFLEKASAPMFQRYLSLFPGLGFAAGYKVSQRVYKFGGQPMVKDYLINHHQNAFVNRFGEKNAKIAIHATAGSIIGVGEIGLLPLDVLKIRAQTNPSAIAGRGIAQLVQTEGISLYRGAGWTAARNAPGSFALFGGAAATKDLLFGLRDYNDATFYQNFVASIFGACCSILVAQPLDVIKTRVQAQPFDSPESGVTVLRNLLRNEGPQALLKGVVPKLSVVGPKLVFSFTIAQHVIALLEKSL